jgi:acyl-CoA synthetase (AMP-forming)/AMP-acid ligase II
VPALREALPRLRLIVGIDARAAGAVLLDDWQGDPADWRDLGTWSPEDLAAIVASGGTTGSPKGIMQSHRGLASYVANHLATMPADTPPRYLVAAPMTHAAGLMCLPMLVRGGTVFVIDGAQPRAVADAIRRWAITDIFLPPTVIYTMLADPEIAAMTFPSLRYLLYGAAPMSVSKLREALALFGPVMVHGFGQMEAIMLCSVLAPADHYREGEIADDERLSSCGRPAPFVNLAIMAEDGTLLGPAEVGEIVVRGGNVMLGYFGDPEATAEASRFGWHHTGDLGYRDGEGFYHIVDRARDMIISGGFNIFPSEIEQHLWTHPAVSDCAVIGAPDEKWGEAVTAVIELKPGATVSAEELIALCRARLGSIKAPKRVEFWPELPRSAVGKVLKRQIRDRFWDGRQSRI